MKPLLIDKHKPRYLEDFNLEKSYIDYIDQIIFNTDLNVLLYGMTGTGKTCSGSFAMVPWTPSGLKI